MALLSRQKRREVTWAYLFLLPALNLFIFVVVYPLLYALWLGFYEWPVFGEKAFIGFGNFAAMCGDPLFYRSVLNTVYWTVGVVPGVVLISLAVALLLNAGFVRWRALFRTAYFIPVVTSMVAVAFVWKWLFEPTFGVVNWLLGVIGIRGPGWLASTTWALPAMMVVGVWKQVGFAMVISLAGLQTIPRELREAAIIDGAGAWQAFARVVLPLPNPTVVFVMIMLVINAFRVFTIPYVMSAGGFTYGTLGGPLDSTRVFVIHIYDLGFRKFEIGYASATAFVLLVIIMIVTIVQMKILERPFEY